MQDMIRKTGADFARIELRKNWDALDEENSELLNRILIKAAENGVFSFVIDEAAFGSGFSVKDYCVFLEEISRACSGIGAVFASHLMGIAPILISTDADKRKRLLSLVVDTECQGLPALFAPAIGEDRQPSPICCENIQTMLSTKGVIGAGTGMVSGIKTNVVSAEAASYFTLPAKRDSESFAWVVIPADAKGITIKKSRPKIGMKICPINDVIFDDVEVDEENILPACNLNEEVVKCFEFSDAPFASIALGVALEAYTLALKYSVERYQGGKMICDHDAVKMLLADMAVSIHAARGMICGADSLLSSGFAAQAAEKICLDAIQVHGGYGYMKDYKIERMLRDTKTLQSIINPHARKMAHIAREIENAR